MDDCILRARFRILVERAKEYTEQLECLKISRESLMPIIVLLQTERTRIQEANRKTPYWPEARDINFWAACRLGQMAGELAEMETSGEEHLNRLKIDFEKKMAVWHAAIVADMAQLLHDAGNQAILALKPDVTSSTWPLDYMLAEL